jgi:hypothetical protein
MELALDLDDRLGVRLDLRQERGQPLDAVAGFLDEERDEIGELWIHKAPVQIFVQ